MSHLERLSYIIGTLLVGVTAFLVLSEGGVSRRRKGDVPVEKLAEELKGAWAGYHTP